ncbi:unnamed protein product [Bursaphelenchus okinawaensis]|uniref:Autophagy-related protein 16 domain-containing protein n=1 Tax=Bursaphelenchus okinawaensis TaxID=465554 RepID=A0A811KQC8_9BILA|nr:unnamed protein product [Bursaphelenchus okinawaensis]CAG9110285.1 unnamed protein product [Bursaphelenchus okinawaensis]
MSYRDEILKSLKERDRFIQQFARIVESYASLSDSLNYVLSRQRIDGGTTTTESSKDTEELRKELSEVYKRKAANDELLIEAQKKVRELEKRLTEVVEDKGSLEHEVKELKEEIKKKVAELEEYKRVNALLNDELLATHIQVKSLNTKFVNADQERVVLLNKIKELKEKEIEYMNEFNDKEHQIRLQRLRSEIDEATKPSSQSSSRRNSRKYSETSSISAFDSIPTKCEFKFECDSNGEVNDIIWNRSGRLFYTGGSDKLIRIYEPQPNAPPVLKAKMPCSTKAINRLDLHPDSPLLLAACSDNTAYLFDTDGKKKLFSFTGHSDKVLAAKFLPQSNRIVTGSSDRTLRLWDQTSRVCVRTLMPASMCSDIATCNRGIASSHYDKWIRLWDGRSETPYHQIKMDGRITSLNLSTDGQLLLACCRDETLSLIDLRQNEVFHIYSADQFRTSYEYCKCAISPGGGYVSAGSWDGQLFIWNLHSTKLEKILNGHDNNPLYAVAWNPNDGSILSADKKRTACMWM